MATTWGNCGLFVFHHCKGSSFPSITLASKYLLTYMKPSVVLIQCRVALNTVLSKPLHNDDDVLLGCGMVGGEWGRVVSSSFSEVWFSDSYMRFNTSSFNLLTVLSTAAISENIRFLNPWLSNVETTNVKWCSSLENRLWISLWKSGCNGTLGPEETVFSTILVNGMMRDMATYMSPLMSSVASRDGFRSLRDWVMMSFSSEERHRLALSKRQSVVVIELCWFTINSKN